MERRFALALLVALAVLPGCEIVGGIFKAGVWVGIVLVVLLLAGLFWLMRKLRR
jgi:hypothetical protein